MNLIFEKSHCDEINNSGYKAYITVAGGCNQFIGEYLKHSGASKFLMGFNIPYNQVEFDSFIGGKPDKYVSSEAAQKLAVASFEKAVKISGDRKNSLGVGASCSVAKDGERDGREHWTHIAVHAANFTAVISREISWLDHDRAAEDALMSDLLFKTIYFVTTGNKLADDFCTLDRMGNNPYLTDLATGPDLRGNFHHLVYRGKRMVIFPGSFNLCHAGHLAISEAAKEILGQYPIFEISVKNTEKPPVNHLDLNARLASIGDNDFLVTNAPLFSDKVNLIMDRIKPSELIFVVGYDTWRRVKDCKYHENWDGFFNFIESLYENNVKFLVFGRNGETVTEDDDYSGLLINDDRAVNFRMDVSSSEMRKGVCQN